MTSMLPCSRSGIAVVLWVTVLTVTFRPACVKYPSLSATCSPAVSTTGSDPTTMLVPAAVPPAGELAPGAPPEALAPGAPPEALAPGAPPELLLELLPELHAAASTATEMALMTLRPSRLGREYFMTLLWTARYLGGRD